MSDKVPIVVVFDLECTVRGGPDNPPNPYHKDNYIVAMGADLTAGGKYTNAYLNSNTEGPRISGNTAGQVVGIVGHHLMGVDLPYLRKASGTIEGRPVREFLADGVVWDTGIAEYVMSGQQLKYPSLDELSVKYGGVLKDDKIKGYWESGMDTPDIPSGELLSYLEADVTNTRLVYNEQLKALGVDNPKTNLILSMCRTMCGFHEIQYNGLTVDKDFLTSSRAILEAVISGLQARIDFALNRYSASVSATPHVELSSTSNTDLSTFLFGGTVTVHVSEVVGTFKNGRPKTKLVPKNIIFPRLINPDGYTTEGARKGTYSVSESVLEAIEKSVTIPPGVRATIQDILKVRKHSKILSTYIKPLLEFSEANSVDNRIHANYNLTGTDTGRVSSSRPNMQNIPSGDDDTIKKAFVSRWGNQGVLIEVDYRQLEVVCLAHISGDLVLQNDLRSGIDIHDKLASELYKRPVTQEERRVVKTINFGLIYGGSAKSLAEQAGVTVEFTKKAINAFYGRYRGVYKWHTELQERARREGKLTTERTPQGYPVHEWEYTLATGRTFVFKEEDNKFNPGQLRWPITKMKNYPVQGLATGDIVPTMVGVMFSRLMANPGLRDTCLIVNQVHDSLLFDCRSDYSYDAAKFIKEVLESAPEVCNNLYPKLNFTLPLNVKVTMGPNWKDQETIEF